MADTTAGGVVAGVTMIAASALEILAMAHHPSVKTADVGAAISQIGELASLAAWVHGVLIGLLLLVAYGCSVFAAQRDARRPLIRMGAIAYAGGVIFLIGAALVSGWLIARVVAFVPHASDVDRLIASQLLNLCAALNQTCAAFGTFSLFAGMGFWSLDLLTGTRVLRLVGLLGLGAAIGILGALLTGALQLDVHGMSLVVLLQTLWSMAIGALLIGQIAGRVDGDSRGRWANDSSNSLL